MKLLSIAGCRPTFVKLAPLAAALAADGRFEHLWIHSGQHHSAALDSDFRKALALPEPYANLHVNGGSSCRQTADMMIGFERAVADVQPDAVLVLGDTNCTVAAARVAADRGLPLIHVEAGLRSGDRSMPEEINRIWTDAVSDVMFATTRDAMAHCDPSRWVFHAGNLMVDALYRYRARIERATDAALVELGLNAYGYALLTLHRRGLVETPGALATVLERIRDSVGRDMPVLFPAHPRTREAIGESWSDTSLYVVPPMEYFDFVALENQTRLVITDSGGVQEETSVLGVPCFTVRDNTERPVTVDEGTNLLVGADAGGLAEAYATWKTAGAQRLDTRAFCARHLWDGQTAGRIVRGLARVFNLPAAAPEVPVEEPAHA